MTEHRSASEVVGEILEEVPAARRALLESQVNLLRVAEFCDSNYLQADDTAEAVGVAKALAAQALASVTYQIHSLAGTLLRLLDSQNLQVQDLESSVHLLALAAALHYEKVARRDVGSFTVPKVKSRSKALAGPPSGREPQRRYARAPPVSYAALDSLGHCFQVAEQRRAEAAGSVSGAADIPVYVNLPSRRAESPR